MPVRLLKTVALGLLALAVVSVGVAMFGGPTAGGGDPASFISAAVRVFAAAGMSLAALLSGVLPSGADLPSQDDSAACLLNTSDCWINHASWWPASLGDILAPAFTPGGFTITVLVIAVIAFLAGRLSGRAH